MSIAEKLTTIAENQQRVYDAGYANGQASGDSAYNAGYSQGLTDGVEQGKQAEKDRFWNIYENNGGNYEMAFGSPGWTDETYNPKRPIICTQGAANNMFRNAKITNTKQPIEIRVASADNVFLDCAELKTIPYIGFFGVTSNSSFFSRCGKLENVTFDGEIKSGIGLNSCPKLTSASIQSIIDHLADLTGQTTKTIRIHADTGAKMTEAQKATITAKNWTLAY